jgi:hypothetical protein
MPGHAKPQPVNGYIGQKDAERMFVVYWYRQGSHAVANGAVTQLYALPEMILHGRPARLWSGSSCPLPAIRRTALVPTRFSSRVISFPSCESKFIETT